MTGQVWVRKSRSSHPFLVLELGSSFLREVWDAPDETGTSYSLGEEEYIPLLNLETGARLSIRRSWLELSHEPYSSSSNHDQLAHE